MLSQTCSIYTSLNTAKSLVGIAPSGFVTFVSSLYGGGGGGGGHISAKMIMQ